MAVRFLFVGALVGLAGCAGSSEDDAPSFSEAATTSTPAELGHSNADTPVPNWNAAIRSWEGPSSIVRESVIRMLGGNEGRARARFEGWPVSVRRGFVIVIDKLANEGWIDNVDHIEGEPWDCAFHFWSRDTWQESLEHRLAEKARAGVYVENSISNGLPAYFNSSNHRDWRRGWAETDVRNGSLHVGIFANNKWEVHMELYNPMFISGAPAGEVIGAPLVGYVNARMFYLHQKWEAGAASKNRTSANYWHFLKNSGFPLSF